MKAGKASGNRVPSADPAVDPKGQGMGRLASLIKAYAPHDGAFELRVPGVHAIRRSRVYTELMHGVQRSALCVVAQGAKSVTVGSKVYEYDASRMIVFSVDMPVAAQVTRATPSEPFLGLRLDFDPQKVANAVLKVFPHGLPPVREDGAVYIAQADGSILNAAIRLIELMAQREDAELLAPLVVEEMLIRLLRGPVGPRVAQIGVADSGVYGVAKAVSWLRANFSQPMKVEELARLANMSVSFVSPALQVRHFHEPVAVPESAASSGSQAADVVSDDGRRDSGPKRGVPERFAVQQGVWPLLWERTNPGHLQTARTCGCGGRRVVRSTCC